MATLQPVHTADYVQPAMLDVASMVDETWQSALQGALPAEQTWRSALKAAVHARKLAGLHVPLNG